MKIWSEILGPIFSSSPIEIYATTKYLQGIFMKKSMVLSQTFQT